MVIDGQIDGFQEAGYDKKKSKIPLGVGERVRLRLQER